MSEAPTIPKPPAAEPRDPTKEPEVSEGEVIIKAVDIHRHFLIRKGLPILKVLKGVSIEIRQGECLSIVGESGVGKSTLLHILGLLDAPTAGQVFYRGKEVTALPYAEQCDLRNQAIGFVFQFYHLLPDLTALENTVLPRMIHHGIFSWSKARKKAREKAEWLMEQVGLKDRRYSRPSQLSGGEQQRVALVRGLVNDPEVLLCDEPTGNLDPRTAEGLKDLIFRLRDSLGQTIVLVTHNEDLANRADRKLRILDGKFTREERRGPD